MNNNTTILYYTDNGLEPKFEKFVQDKLIAAANGKRIISVSQKPIPFGDNICVGDIGRSWLSLYKQLLAGLEATTTEFVAMAENDVLYTSEHFDFIPPTTDKFYYNHNNWLVQWNDTHPELKGMYSYIPNRFALSQLICSTELLKTSTKEVMALLEMGMRVEKGMRWHGEPGLVADTHKAFLLADSGRPTQLQTYLTKYLTKYTSESFSTKNPNLDIRHSTNFTGPKRGKKRTFEDPYWGVFANLMK